MSHWKTEYLSKIKGLRSVMGTHNRSGRLVFDLNLLLNIEFFFHPRSLYPLSVQEFQRTPSGIPFVSYNGSSIKI